MEYDRYSQRQLHFLFVFLQLSETSFGVDRRVSNKIKELAALGIHSIPEVRQHLMNFLHTDLFAGKPLPRMTDTRYWPTNQQILGCLYRAKRRIRYGTPRNPFLSLCRTLQEDFEVLVAVEIVSKGQNALHKFPPRFICYREVADLF